MRGQTGVVLGLIVPTGRVSRQNHIRVNAVRRPLIRVGQAWRHPPSLATVRARSRSAGSWLAWAEDFEGDPQQQRHAKEQADIAEQLEQ
jgi:hypothetical protein